MIAMPRILRVVGRARALLLCSLLAGCAAGESPKCPAAPARAAHVPPGPIQHVVVVSIDGLKPDSYLHPESHGLSVPTLRWMVQHGAASDGVESVFPTVTYPSHTSMVTGVAPGKHGIVSNRSFDPLENDLESWRWYSSELRVDPIWRIAERQGYDAALVHWPVSVGAEVKWLVPEFWRAKTVHDQKLLRVVSTPGLLDDVAKEHADFWDRYVPPAVRDDALTDIALHVLRAGRPRLTMLHLIEVDSTQHHYGVDSAEARTAIETDDRQLARILAALKDLGLAERTAVLVVSDHGFRPTSKMVRPCVLLKEAGLIDVTPDGKISDWKATVLTNWGQAYVYVKDPSDAATREKVRGIFKARQAQPESGIGRIYDAEEIRARGGDTSALMAIEPVDDYQYGPGCLGSYTAPPAYRGNHGFDPARPEMRASMLMVGPSIPHGTIERARIVDVAPTIAAWLALPIGPVDGSPVKVSPK
jgi:predicted AlkP superfamily pyrophosphatase or phosphodiesterase